MGGSEPTENKLPTDIDGPVLRAWATAAKDPAVHCVDWIDRTGSPAGISKEFQLDKIWPLQDDDHDEHLQLHTDFDEFINYAGFDKDEDAFQELMSFTKRQKLLSFKNLKECEQKLGRKPHLSRFGLLTRIRNGKMKKRVILDCKQSGLSRRTRRKYKVILPKVTDCVRDVLILSTHKERDQAILVFVLDFIDAFWNIPLDPEEIPWFCGKVRNIFLAYANTAQGSRNGPLSWCTIAALLARLTQGLFNVKKEARIQCYVDDPSVAVCGNKRERQRIIAIIITVWRVAGFKLAFHKGMIGQKVTWVGADISITDSTVTVSIPGDKIAELQSLTKQMLACNIISVKSLRTYNGKVTSLASLVDVLRPFATELYAALKSPEHPELREKTKAPENCIWEKQIDIALHWIQAFLAKRKGALERVFTVNAFNGVGVRITIRFDASPWGLGGILLKEEVPVAWIAAPITEDGIEILGVKTGDRASQQAR